MPFGGRPPQQIRQGFAGSLFGSAHRSLISNPSAYGRQLHRYVLYYCGDMARNRAAFTILSVPQNSDRQSLPWFTAGIVPREQGNLAEVLLGADATSINY